MWMSVWTVLRLPVLSFLGIVASIVGGFGALTLFGLGNAAVPTSLFYAYAPGIVGSALLVLLGGFMLFAAALSLVFGVGIWTRSPQIWTLGVLSQGFILLVAFAELCNGALLGAQMLSLLLAGAILAILYAPAFQESLITQR